MSCGWKLYLIALYQAAVAGSTLDADVVRMETGTWRMELVHPQSSTLDADVVRMETDH